MMRVGERVRIHSLAKFDELNGKLARLKKFVENRWRVKIDGFDKCHALRLENLEAVDEAPVSQQPASEPPAPAQLVPAGQLVSLRQGSRHRGLAVVLGHAASGSHRVRTEAKVPEVLWVSYRSASAAIVKQGLERETPWAPVLSVVKVERSLSPFRREAEVHPCAWLAGGCRRALGASRS